MEIIMSKRTVSEIITVATQTLPFLMITATFIGIAYIYGHTASPSTLETAFEASKINFSYLL